MRVSSPEQFPEFASRVIEHTTGRIVKIDTGVQFNATWGMECENYFNTTAMADAFMEETRPGIKYRMMAFKCGGIARLCWEETSTE